MPSENLEFEISNTVSMKQRNDTIFIFSLSATNLLKYCKVDRFYESDNGVQRQQRDRRVEGLVKAMREPDTIFVEPIIVNLAGGKWKFEKSKLISPVGGYLSVDDGQHRLAALAQLTPDERRNWVFAVHATNAELSHERRVRMFLQQELGAPIDARLQLAQSDYIDEWKSDTHRDAYQICKALGEDDDSVIAGMVLFRDLEHRPRENSGKIVNGINVKGLHNALVVAKNRGSVLNELSLEQQIKVIKTYLRVASETWPGSWNRSKQTLSTARGIGALIELFGRSPHFTAVVGTTCTEKRFREVFALMKPYSWSVTQNRLMNVSNMVDRLDGTIQRSRLRAANNSVETD